MHAASRHEYDGGHYAPKGCKGHVEGCTFNQNDAYGVAAFGKNTVVSVKGCHSRQHSTAGNHATCNVHMMVSSSASEGHKHSCTAVNGAQLTMQEVTVDGTLQSGPLPQALPYGAPPFSQLCISTL